MTVTVGCAFSYTRRLVFIVAALIGVIAFGAVAALAVAIARSRTW